MKFYWFLQRDHAIKIFICLSGLLAILLRVTEIPSLGEHIYFLQSMSCDEIAKTKEALVKIYAQDLLKAGCCTTEAEALQRASYDIYHESSLKNYFFAIKANGFEKSFGYIWFDRCDGGDSKEALLGDVYVQMIFIEQEFRGKGIAKKVLRDLEKQCKAQGALSIGLFVFAHNEHAYNVYKKLGYTTTKISAHSETEFIGFYMKKDLS